MEIERGEPSHRARIGGEAQDDATERGSFLALSRFPFGNADLCDLALLARMFVPSAPSKLGFRAKIVRPGWIMASDAHGSSRPLQTNGLASGAF